MTRLLLPWVLLSVVACVPDERADMISLETPPRWDEQIEAFRESKDEQFRTALDSPLSPEQRESFPGLDYYEPDPELYFVGPINFLPEPEPLQMITTAGQPRPCERVGWIEFAVAGEPVQLQVYRMTDNPQAAEDFFLPFQDATTGEETYPAGRYVELSGPPGGPFVLDFNTAYNPYCAYGHPERFACPVTPKDNRLEVRIAAGERGYEDS